VKPNPQQVQMVLEWFAELLMNTTRETVDPPMRAAAEDICGEYADIVPIETRNLMGFFMNLRKLMVEVCFAGPQTIHAQRGSLIGNNRP
jgi:kinetochore protein Nuf2